MRLMKMTLKTFMLDLNSSKIEYNLNRWKLSNEQLNNIFNVLSFDNCTPKRKKLLESLYHDLKN